MSDSLVGASREWKPLSDLLEELTGRVVDAIPGCLGAALSVRHGAEPLTVLSAQGLAARLAPAQLGRLGGPIADAAATGEAVVTEDVFADPRWPRLVRENLGDAVALAKVRGVAALPSDWDGTGTLVLSAVLDRAADTGTVRVLHRYERLASATLMVAHSATTGDVEQMLRLLASRAAIEEAKGAIIAVRRCGADEAWATLRRASQEFNVKVRELAVALVEHLGDAPAPRPDGTPEIVPTDAAREAARLVWAALAAPRT